MGQVCNLRVVLVWFSIIFGIFHCAQSQAIQCYSCSGSICLQLFPDKISSCSPGDGGKCFIRSETNGAVHWGCAKPRQGQSSGPTREDGCHLLGPRTQPGAAILCLCSKPDHCNTNIMDLVTKIPSNDTPDILLHLSGGILQKQLDSASVQDNHRTDSVNNVIPLINRKKGEQFSLTQYRRDINDKQHDAVRNYERPTSFTVAEKNLKGSRSINNVVHGSFDTEPFIPKYRDCRIHNGYCDHVCVMSWNGMGYCICHPGYRLSTNLKTCDDINECYGRNGGCEHTCHNTPGSYHCQCQPGYNMAADNKTCTEINECLTLERGGCSHGCDNLPGSYLCICPPGFHLMDNAKTCQDTDECSDRSAKCQQLCTNTQGSYKCGCTTGFILHQDGFQCIDMDECSINNGGCNQECINSLGSYACGCRMGYDFGNDTFNCHDVNECEDNDGGCEHYCVNSDGSYNCSCALGYGLMDDNKSCKEMIPGDKCIKDNGGCDHHCEVVDASTVRCTCNTGYELLSNDKTCVDIDECASAPCEGRCENTEGAYRCLCAEGFTLHTDGSCTDIDECSVKNGGCGHRCMNTAGSYFCACVLGFWLGPDAHQCVDVDECQMNNGGCAGTCHNSIGSYNCSCAAGYRMDIDHKSCRDVDECSAHSYGGCDQICVNTAGSYLCGCADGYRLADDGTSCNDMDECHKNNGGCDQRCVNMRGAYRCQCFDGYTRDHYGVCQDIDECFYGLHNCSTHCVNQPGGFKCACPPGYRVADDGSTCEDDNECSVNNGGCEQFCVNIQGSYRCACAEESGFILAKDGKTCDLNCPELFSASETVNACYHLALSEKRNFEESEEYCRGLHGQAHLITLDNTAALHDLNSGIIQSPSYTNGTSLWTSGRYWQPISNFVWISSFDVISNVNVTIHSDSSLLKDMCVLATFNSSTNNTVTIEMSAEDCDLQFYSICEIRIQH